jgi:hypothetical protein
MELIVNHIPKWIQDFVMVYSELQKLEPNHQISLYGMCTPITQLLFGVNYKTWNIPLIIVDDAHIDVQASE